MGVFLFSGGLAMQETAVRCLKKDTGLILDFWCQETENKN